MANVSAFHPPQGDAGRGPDTDHQRGQGFGQHTDNVTHTQTQAIGPVLNHKLAPSVPSTIPTSYQGTGSTVNTRILGLPLHVFNWNLVEPAPFKLPRLNEDNFDIWSPIMKSFLRSRKLWGIVDGTVPCPSDPFQAENWTMYAHFVAGMFISHATDTQVSYILCDDDMMPKEIYDTWNTMYLDRLRGQYVCLLNKIITTKVTKGDRVDEIATSIKRADRQVSLVKGEKVFNDFLLGLFIMNAFKGIRKFDLAINYLESEDEDDFSSLKVIQRLKWVEQNAAERVPTRNGGRGRKGRTKP